MKSQLYTNIVLSLIACLLIILILQNQNIIVAEIPKDVKISGEPIHVNVDNDVSITGDVEVTGSVEVENTNSIPVRIEPW